MVNHIFSIELLHQGKYDSWGFETEDDRNQFYEKIKEAFKEHELDEESATDDTRIVQLSATNLDISEEGVNQTIPYVWYDQEIFEKILKAINSHYGK